MTRIQNAAARVLAGAKKFDHITPILKRIHWLPIQYRIKYKILLLVFKALHGKAPEYIMDMIKPLQHTRTLRSSSKALLVVPRSRTVRYGDRAFSRAAPVLWNQLPFYIANCDNIDCFKTELKTYLFNIAFNG